MRSPPAVVEIFTTSYSAGDGLVPRSADLITTERASGSGVIVDPGGYIVTNAHVVRGAQRRARRSPAPGSRQVDSRGAQPHGDRPGRRDRPGDGSGRRSRSRRRTCRPWRSATPTSCSAGQLVLAFGSPLGLHNSVSLGVVSAVARQLEPESPMIYVQTDASINPGSSGGPAGRPARAAGRHQHADRVAEPAATRASGSPRRATSFGPCTSRSSKIGRVRRGDIGVRAQTVTPVLAAGLGLARDQGVVLADVLPGSPAARAGLRPGDIVLTLDGKPMENGRQLQVSLYRRFVGDVVTLEILRDGQTHESCRWRWPSAAIRWPACPSDRSAPEPGAAAGHPRREPGPARSRRCCRRSRVRSGVVVAVDRRGRDRFARRRAGRRATSIYAVNRTPVAGIAELRTLLDGLKTGDPVVLQLERRGELMYLPFTVE